METIEKQSDRVEYLNKKTHTIAKKTEIEEQKPLQAFFLNIFLTNA